MRTATAQDNSAPDERESAYPFALDIAIPEHGLDDRAISLLETCMFRCRGAVERWSYPLEIDGPVVKRWVARIGFGVAAEADWAAAMLRDLDAKRVR